MWYELRSSRSSLTSAHHHDRIYPVIMSKRDSSTSVADEDVGDGDDSTSSKVVIQEHSSFQFEGVRFTPKLIEFNDAFEGRQFQQKIKLQNVGKNPVMVKIGGPSSFVFHMNKHDRCARLLPSGRSIKRTLSYVYHNDDLVRRSQIRVQINGRSIDYPIVVRRAVPLIEVQPPELDFNVINMGASAKTLKISITNTGGKGTKFAIDLGRNELDLVVNPPRGTIRAKNQMNVFVEMVGLTEGEFFKEMWITTKEKPIRVPIIAKVMRPRLEVFHPNATGDFTLINFPVTFSGTQRLDSIVLRNFSADVTPFVIFAEMGGELKSCRDAKKLPSAYQMFTMSEDEGRLQPFESRIITLIFKPIKSQVQEGWRSKKSDELKNVSNEYLVFYRINTVHCVEKKELERSDTEQRNTAIMTQKEIERKQSVMVSVASIMAFPVALESTGSKSVDPGTEEKRISQAFLPMPIEDKDVVRLCLHGEACEPSLLVQPNTFYFEEVLIGKTVTKVFNATNQSPISIKFQIQKAVNIRTNPKEGWLKPKESIDVTVWYTPTFLGKMSSAIKIEILGKSAVLLEEDKSIVSLAVVKIPFSSVVKMTGTSLQPKIGFGISPRLGNEVGLFPELVTYGSDHPKPYSAILGALKEKSKPRWMVEESDKVNNVLNAVIAFPNDRPRRLHHEESNKRVYRSIFTGHYRYAPPIDETYALTVDQMDKRAENLRLWTEYLRQTMDMRKGSLSDEKLHDDSSDRHLCLALYDPKAMKKLDVVAEKERADQFKCSSRNGNLLPKFVLLPLSPVFLCNIKVEPKLIDFAMVAPNSSVAETLKLHNMNPFPVSVRFIPGKSGVTLPDGDVRIVPPLTRKLLQIVFKTKDLGRYNGFLDYVINGSHQFKITVSANVVPKTLVIAESEHNVEFGNYSSMAAFQPNMKSITLINNLRSPIKYHWEMERDSAFEVEPINGEIPPMISMMNHVYFNLHPEKSYSSQANLISESGSVQAIKLSYRKTKTNVFFLANKIELKKIPLNLVERVKPTIRNVNYYDIAFQVLDSTPMPGVQIYPSDGVIKARSMFDLVVEFQIPVIIDFQFDIKVRVQQGPMLCLKVCGSVVCPMVRVTPVDLTMRRVAAYSFDVASMCVENIGTTPALVVINLEEYPEYRISRTKDKSIDDLGEKGIFLLPQKSCKFFLHFEPTDVARYQFYLPIVVNNILGPRMMQDSASENVAYYLEAFEDSYTAHGELTRSADLKLKVPCVCVNCTVVGHMLKFSCPKFFSNATSTLEVAFEKMQSCRDKFQEEEIEVTNIHTQPLTICIRTDDINNKFTPFSLIPYAKKVETYLKSIKVHLQAGEVLILKVGFQPMRAGEYAIEVPIFVKGCNDGYAYNFLRLTGEMKKARIWAETKEIHFPPVPLGVGTEVIMQVFAERYDYPDLITYAVWEVEEYGKIVSESVKVLWLDEPRITGTRELQTFAIQVSFQNAFPLALRTFLIFFDSKGDSFPVLITAITDNSTLTNHIFLSTKSNKYKIVRSQVSSKTQEEELASYFLKGQMKNKFGENATRKGLDFAKKHKLKMGVSSRSNQVTQYSLLVKIDSGPKLSIQMTKSMQRITQLNFVGIRKPYESKKKDPSILYSLSASNLSHLDLGSDSNKSSLKTGLKGNSEVTTDVTYPYFPASEETTYYEKYLTETLKYVERWVYEVVFHCEEYLTIPYGFQMAGSELEPYQRTKSRDQKELTSKTIVDLVAELAGPKVRQFFPDMPVPPKDAPNRVDHLFSMFSCLLHFLHVQGSFLPHVRPEYLLSYPDYLSYVSKHPTCEALKCLVVLPFLYPSSYGKNTSMSIVSGGNKSIEKEDIAIPDVSMGTLTEAWNKSMYDENFEDEAYDSKEKKVEIDESAYTSMTPASKRAQSLDYGWFKDATYKTDIMDEKCHWLRTTQAWLDVIVQIFRTLVLPKIVYRKMISTGLPELGEKFSVESLRTNSCSTQEVPHGGRNELNVENLESNIVTPQERILLGWLKHHYDLQRTILSSSNCQPDCGKMLPQRNIDNFRTDLSDGLVLMAVTASYCPYLIPHYFVDVFPEPESQEQIYHNTIKLTSAWREVNIGLTVEPKDIIQSNGVFMLMIVCHLYEMLPVLCPRSLIRFSAPLTEEVTRTIELNNKERQKIVYEAKFIGDNDGSFRLVNSPTIILRPNKKIDLKIVFRARRVHKVSVTLLLDGVSTSPHFAKSIVFSLEGEPSKLTEFNSIKLQGSLYNVMCLDIPITPPYEEDATYEISYSAISPNESDPKLIWMKPWREIWNRKTARRLFLNQGYLYYDGQTPAMLNVTIACLTRDVRNFWLLFRSEIGDFIVRIDILPKRKGMECGPSFVNFPKMWSETAVCTCVDVNRILSSDFSTTSICPLLSYLHVPARNNYLWNTMFVMFQKTLDPKEKSFWKQHFETNIGIRLIKWLLSQDENTEVVDEFIPLLRTNMTYSLKLDSNAEKYVRILPTLEVPDVRSPEPLFVPIHVANNTPPDLRLTLTMTSDNKKEIRVQKYVFQRVGASDNESRARYAQRGAENSL